jgi:hypothetical protein
VNIARKVTAPAEIGPEREERTFMRRILEGAASARRGRRGARGYPCETMPDDAAR